MSSPVVPPGTQQWLTGTDMAAFTVGLLAVLVYVVIGGFLAVAHGLAPRFLHSS